MTLTDLIAQTEAAVSALSPSTALAEYRDGIPAGDACDKFLCSVAAGSVDLTDRQAVAAELLRHALLRAWEVMLMDCVECDEDRCFLVTDWYQQRHRWFRRALADVAVRGPMEVAKNSQWILTGLTQAMTRKGAKDPEVVAAWELVKQAVAQTFPQAYQKKAKAHQTAYERFVARHMERAS